MFKPRLVVRHFPSHKTFFSKLYCNSAPKPSYKKALGEEPLRRITTGLLLEEASNKFGDRLAVISKHQHRSLTFSQTLEEADRLAASFRKIGLKRGDRVGIWIPNLLEWYTTKMACARGGFIAAGINPGSQPPELEYCINKIGIKALVCADSFKSQDYYESLLKIDPSIKTAEAGKIKSERVPSLKSVIQLVKDNKGGVFALDNLLNLASQEDIKIIKSFQNEISCDDPYNVKFTSGTTGKPKGVILSHFGMVNNGYFVGKRNELHKKHHKICVQVPLFHVFGTVVSIMAALNHGATLVLPTDGYNAEKSIDAIKEERCTIIYGTPTMYVDLIQRQEERQEDLSSLEIAVSGGALCSPHLFKKMQSILNVKKVKSVYGLTEATAILFQSLPTDNEEKVTTTVGHVGEHIEVKVVDTKDNIVPFGTPGELYVKSYGNMLSYWDDKEKTNETLTEDGWLRTGDRMILQEDGYGKIVGRFKDIIIRGGENIFPKEIEDHLNTHPDILESNVIGLPHERLGEEVCACIRVKPGRTVTLKNIKDFCKEHITYSKIPSKMKLFDQFPKTLSGKIKKFELIEQVTKM